MKKIIPLVDVTALQSRAPFALDRNAVEADHMNRFEEHHMNFEKNLGLVGKYCYHPFNTVTIDHQGRCYVCICQAWLPISVGNILEFNSFEEIVQSPRAREIQRSIIDGSYKYCDHTTCTLIAGNQLETKIDHKPDTINWINFAIDDSCNLQCPSCRTGLRFIKEGAEFELRNCISDHVARLISNHENFMRFTLSGDGDPFASHVYRNLMSKIHGRPKDKLEIEIVTNGMLLKAHWNDIQNIHHNIIRVRVSFDAGSADTYHQVRRGGDWNRLLENSRFLTSWLRERKKNKLNIGTTAEANFVVQASNYHEMVDYVALCRDIGFDRITFQKVTNWNTWIQPDGTDKFYEHAVWMPQHPEYNQFKEVLKNPVFDDWKVKLGNLLDIT